MNNIYESKKYEQQSRERINALIAEYCDGSQQRFVEMTGINKGSVSQYCNGKMTPSSANAKKIGQVFKVNPAWIMGFDVPKNNDIPGPQNLPHVAYTHPADIQYAASISQEKTDNITSEELLLIENYRKLDPMHQGMIKQTIDDYISAARSKEIRGQQTIFDWLENAYGKDWEAKLKAEFSKN